MSVDRELGEIKTMISMVHADVKEIKNGTAPVCMHHAQAIEKLEGRPEKSVGLWTSLLSIMSMGFAALTWIITKTKGP